MKAAHLKQGEDAEAACSHYLKSRGLKLVNRNFSCRFGEIDIIMLDNNILVFVEVRFRKNNNFGGGLESITTEKQRKLRRTAELYLQQNRQYENARIANRLLRRVRDFAEVKGDGLINAEIAAGAMDMLKVDACGFDTMDRRLLRLIIDNFAGGPV